VHLVDLGACPGGCSWVYVDEDLGYGICSSCPEVFEDFRARLDAADQVLDLEKRSVAELAYFGDVR
jgi:hypothetical protein